MTALHSRSKQRQSAAWLVLFLLAVLALAARQPSDYPVKLHVGAASFAVGAAASARSGQVSALAMLPSQVGSSAPGFSPMQPFDLARARLLNAATPFATNSGPAAGPFMLSGSELSRERAIDCLASAMWYEAGNDSRGQQAVGQVVLNRVRNSAFPATVCGVVFQGAERNTGCQFTFTCDGSMGRIPPATAFARARIEARALLDGAVDPEVGLATHYHTDWVHPAWSGAMDKIAQVDTHLFFRWPGKPGRARAAGRLYAGDEPEIAQLAQLSPSHRAVPTPQANLLALSAALPEPSELTFPAANEPTEVARLAKSKPSRTTGSAEGIFQLAIVPTGNGGAQALTALNLCGDRSFCKVVGRVDPALSPGGVAPGDVAFLYVRDKRTGVDRAFWNCDLFRRGNTGQCLTGSNRSWIAFDGNLQSASSRSERAL